jgi:hypothetical protein
MQWQGRHLAVALCIGANDLDRVNFASALRPLFDMGGSGGSKARAFPFPLAALDREGDGSGVGLRPSAGSILINSDPTLEYPRGARRLSQTRNVAEGTRRAAAISSSSGASGTGLCMFLGGGHRCFNTLKARRRRGPSSFGTWMRDKIKHFLKPPCAMSPDIISQTKELYAPPKPRESQNHSSQTSLMSASPRSLNLRA